MGGVFSKPIQAAQAMGVIKPVSPTTAEVSQSAATDATGMDSASKKIKRKGRSATILTSPTGVEGDATLGKKTLLGG